MRNLMWRGRSLYYRVTVETENGKKKQILRPCKIRVGKNATKAEIARCEREGQAILASIETQIRNRTFFDIKKKKPKKTEYNPKVWRLVGRYWHHHLRFKKSADKEAVRLRKILRDIGKEHARKIGKAQLELYLNKMRGTLAVNTINALLIYLKRIYVYANTESLDQYRLNYNPTNGIKRFEGGAVRSFLLTTEKFERNYELLKGIEEKRNRELKRNNTRPLEFSIFYLALWETGRRPEEVAQYTWEMVDFQRQCFVVPGDICKTHDFDELPISDHLFSTIVRMADRQGYVFKNTFGRPWFNYKRQMKKLVREFGKDAGWLRDTRRGFCTRKVEEEGFAPIQVMAVSGHKDISTFKRYHIGSLENKRLVAGSTGAATPVPRLRISTNLVQLEKTA